MSWEEGAGFRVVGCVLRTFISQSGKFAKLTVDVAMHPHPAKIEFKSFDLIVIDHIRQLKKGQRIQVRGKIESEKLTDKSRAAVKVDGYDVWVAALRPSSIEVEGSSRAPAPRAAAPAPAEREPGSDDSDPFAPSGEFDAPKDLPG